MHLDNIPSHKIVKKHELSSEYNNWQKVSVILFAQHLTQSRHLSFKMPAMSKSHKPVSCAAK